jgi:hypothetical protein
MTTGKTGNEAVKKTAAETPRAAEVAANGPATIDVTLEVQGKELTFTCPASAEDAPMDFLLAMEAEKPLTAFAELLGAEGMAEMRAAGARVSDFSNFVMAWKGAAGLGNA